MTRGRSAGETRGLSLVELLVAVAVSGVVLAAAWGWAWQVVTAARAADAGAQARTAAAAAVRALSADLRGAAAVWAPQGRDPTASLALRLRRPDGGEATQVVVWDAARRVLWRNASGTYLAEGVTSFSVTYLDARGRQLPAFPESAARLPARLRLRLCVARTAAGRTATAVAVVEGAWPAQG